VAWIAGQTDRFRCLVNHAGVFDLLGDYAGDVTQGLRQAFGGEAWDGLEAIDRWSPARFAARMRTPMLVTHGERDFRVTVNQGLQCYGLLKAKGVPARLVYFPDEHHWVTQPRNALLWYREVRAWLARERPRAGRRRGPGPPALPPEAGAVAPAGGARRAGGDDGGGGGAPRGG
jgi:dipeptidyl aminopeptidase/acylaminoacyl peptidase